MARVRWLRAVAVISAAALLLASSCSWTSGTLRGVPPPAGAPVPKISTHVKGRGAEQLRDWAQQIAPGTGIPLLALEAYAYAARVAEVENPNCHIAWTTLAGIGMVESHHGTYHGAKIWPNGDVTPPIRGVPLDGTMNNLRIPDSDDSKLDTDDAVVRAMGPMQFIPDTWKLYGVDANNTGLPSPDNIDDAALSAAGYLCYRGKNLATAHGWMEALRAYNMSDDYARAVRDWATAYANGRHL
ncbi:MAG: lytic murein transglycosylase [Mycobacterium sp.]